ncbi:MAG TPA: molybdopterin-dependent oxidoreductase [Spirochaetota bacterium]|nr:molybdopterin-dependent oxidoreductase [Spirochaetota bacterium]
MKKKLLFSVILTLVAVGAIAVLFLTIKTAGKSRADLPPDPESIDIDRIGSDAEFARTIPEYMLKASGLLEEEWSASFLDIVTDFESKTETVTVTGVRSDSKEVTIPFTGVSVSELFKELKPLPGIKNVIVYGSDLYAAVIPYDEFASDDLFIVWKKDGDYMNPSADGVLKLVQDGGPTKRWVKNPVVFDFISDFSDKVPLADRLDADTVNFVSQQSLFSLAIGRVPEIDIGEYSLAIMGLVRNPTTLTYDEIQNLPQVSIYATLETISNPPGGRMIGNAIWTGVPFSSILEMAGPEKGALEVAFRCLDGYSTSIAMDEAMKDGVLLAYRVNGEPLSPTHGFPVRLVVPEKYGMKWPKWINEIEIVDYDYKGYWEMRGWSDYAGRDRPDLRYD